MATFRINSILPCHQHTHTHTHLSCGVLRLTNKTSHSFVSWHSVSDSCATKPLSTRASFAYMKYRIPPGHHVPGRPLQTMGSFVACVAGSRWPISRDITQNRYDRGTTMEGESSSSACINICVKTFWRWFSEINKSLTAGDTIWTMAQQPIWGHS